MEDAGITTNLNYYPIYLNYDFINNVAYNEQDKIGFVIFDDEINTKKNNLQNISIKVNEPMKLAVKIYDGSNFNCKYYISERSDSFIKNSTLERIKTYYSYGKEFTMSSDKFGNKWHVLSNGDGKEIVFNQFSTINNKIEGTINFGIKANSNNECYKLEFMFLPIKEFIIPETGLATIYTPFNDNKENDIYYSIINPSFSSINNLVDNNTGSYYTYRTLNFYETVDNLNTYCSERNNMYKCDNIRENIENNFYFKKLKTLKNGNSNIENFDKLSSSSQSNISKDNLMFVRKDQILRLDYKSFMNVEGRDYIR